MNSNYKLKTKKKKIPFYIEKFKAMVFLIVLIIAVPAYYFIIGPQYDNYQANQNEFEQLEQQSKLNMQQLVASKKIMADYELISQLDKNKIEQILPQQPDLANLYVNLEALVAQHDLELDNMIVEPIKVVKKKVIFADDPKIKEDQLGLVNISLVVTNISYAKMKNFFDTLESNIRLFDVENFNFNPADGKLSISFKTYYLLES